MIIEQLLSGDMSIAPLDETLYKKIKSNWDAVAKPIDSLGVFEEATARIGAILQDESIDVSRKVVITMCADNGVVEEGISQSGQEVTLAVAKAMASRTSSVCKMAKAVGMDVFPIDIGINSDEKVEGLLDRKVSKGTKNFAKEPAMTRAQLLQAIEVGIEAAKMAKDKGYHIICTGEMGIGNTTTSSAVSTSILKFTPRMMVGKGSGLSNAGLNKKVQVVTDAINRYQLFDKGILEIMECVGGYDIAGMAGIMIGGAVYKIPVVVDGVISAVSALCAVKLFPEVADYILGSHVSGEPASAMILSALNIAPVINARMALGEGTGAVMMCSLMDTALTLYKDQLSFDDLKIDQYTRFQN